MGKFYVCEHCGETVEVINDKGVPVVCCGGPMAEMQIKTTEAGTEKHLPAVEVKGDTVTVKVGSVAHPMLAEHLIEWVQLETDQGVQRKHLKAGAEPAVTFHIGNEKPIAVYAYCNAHGLWKTELGKN